MCGRFTLTRPMSLLDIAALAAQLSGEDVALLEQLRPRFNIAPGQDVLVLSDRADRRLELHRWGLIPSWAEDERIGYRMINARAETVDTKPAFRGAFARRRCLVLADGFYEWQVVAGAGPGGAGPRKGGLRTTRKQPYYVRQRDGRPMAFAGLWASWQPAGVAPVRSCTIITTSPNSLVASVHERMPAILPPERFAQWLDPARTAPELRELLRPISSEQLEAYPVTRLVNAATVDCSACIEPLQPGAESPPMGEPAPRRRPRQRKLFD